jgi:hypothetical protein
VLFRWSLPVLLLALARGAPVGVQSLGDVAKREQEKRKVQPKQPVKAFTDADLPPNPGASPDPKAGPSPVPLGAGDAASPGGLPDDEAARKLLERAWRARFDEARANVRSADARAFEKKLDVVWVGGIPYQTWVQVHVETEELKQARQALADLEEEFRRTGLPPGWTR